MDLGLIATADATGWAQALFDEPQREALTRFFGRLHPVAVHLPIGLIVAAGGFELFALLRRRPRSPVGAHCLWLGALAAIVAALFGWLNAAADPPGASVERTLFLHRWSGVALAIAAPLAAILAVAARKPGRSVAWYRLLLLVAVSLVAFGGHLGGELVHGREYVLTPLRAMVHAFRGTGDAVVLADDDDPGAAILADDPSAVPALASLTEQVQAIFDTQCVHCHGPERRKGRLRLDGLASATVDHAVFNVLTADDLESSELLYRVTLPVDDFDRMPADDGALTDEQIATIERWVLGGGPATTDAPAEVPDPAPAPEPAAPPAASTVPVDDLGLPIALASAAERAAALARLAERGAVALPVAETAAAVDVNFALVDPPATDEDLALLAGLEPTLVWLNLTGSSVTDAGLAQLRPFAQLRRLHLGRTAVGDEGLAHLAGHAELRTVNVYGTRVTDAGLADLAALPALERVYVWQTPVTPAGVAAALVIAPELKIERGDDVAPSAEVAVTASDEKDKAPDLPECCASALAAGGECDHACCVAARERGEVCARCSAGQ